jgi:regulator of chromosome condensation
MVIINPMEASTSTITSSNGMISTNTPKAGPVTTDSKTSTRDRKSITFEDHILCESAVPEKRKAKVSVEVSVESSLLHVKKPIGSQPRATKSRAKIVINEAPTAKLNVYVCGEGISGELGLGTAKNAVNVKRPRLNPLLSADEVGVVQIAVGSMHCVALTHDNKILTWGVNDQGALGRNTGVNTFSNIKDRESGISCSQDSAGLNPYEAIPVAIPSTAFPESTIFVEVAAGESSSFVLTDEGLVYGWGTFRVHYIIIIIIIIIPFNYRLIINLEQ